MMLPYGRGSDKRMPHSLPYGRGSDTRIFRSGRRIPWRRAYRSVLCGCRSGQAVSRWVRRLRGSVPSWLFLRHPNARGPHGGPYAVEPVVRTCLRLPVRAARTQTGACRSHRETADPTRSSQARRVKGRATSQRQTKEPGSRRCTPCIRRSWACECRFAPRCSSP